MCQVQIEVIQKRQKEKKAMMSAVKKYQKGDMFIFMSFYSFFNILSVFPNNFHCINIYLLCHFIVLGIIIIIITTTNLFSYCSLDY